MMVNIFYNFNSLKFEFVCLFVLVAKDIVHYACFMRA